MYFGDVLLIVGDLRDFPLFDNGVEGNIEIVFHVFEEIAISDDVLSVEKVANLTNPSITCSISAK